MPMLATAYALHFAKNQLVDMYCEMKRSKDEELIADVHSLSAGETAALAMLLNQLMMCQLKVVISKYDCAVSV